MGQVIIRRSGPKPGTSDTRLAARSGIFYRELEIRSRRVSPTRCEVWVAATPGGRVSEPCVVEANESKLRALEIPFQATLADAAKVGRILAEVLLPTPVYRELQAAIRRLDPRSGLRVRLALDDSLLDLPWEFTFRTEARGGADLPGFLFLDPKLSLVRGNAQKARRLMPSSAPQRLVFLGTYWQGGRDPWGIEAEFDKLAYATRPIGAFLSMHFVDVVHAEEVQRELDAGASILHYSGHTDVDARGRYLVREGSETGGEMPWYAEDVGKTLAKAGARLAVFSACNSGARGFVEPALRHGVPAVIGIQGAIESQSATHFCERLYAALAVGLSLDEAATYARTFIVGAGTLPCDWGRPMVYLATRDAVLFPRPGSRAVIEQQRSVREARGATIDEVRKAAADERGSVGVFISERAQRQVLILGRFSAKRKAVLEALRGRLETSPRHYLPEVFDFEVPKGRRIGETVLTLAGLSRFVIADITDPKSVPAELEKIISQFPSVPVQPILLEGEKPYALFEDHIGKRNVLDVLRYEDTEDLLAKLEGRVLAKIDARAEQLRKRPA